MTISMKISIHTKCLFKQLWILGVILHRHKSDDFRACAWITSLSSEWISTALLANRPMMVPTCQVRFIAEWSSHISHVSGVTCCGLQKCRDEEEKINLVNRFLPVQSFPLRLIFWCWLLWMNHPGRDKLWCVRDEIELAQKVNDMQIRIQLDRQWSINKASLTPPPSDSNLNRSIIKFRRRFNSSLTFNLFDFDCFNSSIVVNISRDVWEGSLIRPHKNCRSTSTVATKSRCAQICIACTSRVPFQHISRLN